MIQDLRIQYNHLLEACDLHFAELSQAHPDDIACSAGCSECCEKERELSMWEAYCVYSGAMAIRMELRRFSRFSDSACAMLNHLGMCMIYPYRPVLCRLYGAPLYYDAENEQSGDVSCCHRNFRSFRNQMIPGSLVADMDEINTMLADLDVQFHQLTGTSGQTGSRVSMHRVLSMIRTHEHPCAPIRFIQGIGAVTG